MADGTVWRYPVSAGNPLKQGLDRAWGEGKSECLRCLLLVMCTYPFAKKALTLHLARSEGRERYFGCNLMQGTVLASSHQPLMAEAPRTLSHSFATLCRSRSALAAVNLLLRKQLRLFVERERAPRCPDNATRLTMASLATMFDILVPRNKRQRRQDRDACPDAPGLRRSRPRSGSYGCGYSTPSAFWLAKYVVQVFRCASSELNAVVFILNREDFSFVIHLDRQPRTSRRREAQTGSRARSGSRSERTLDAVEHSRTLMEWWPFLIFHRGGLRIKVINNKRLLKTPSCAVLPQSSVGGRRVTCSGARVLPDFERRSSCVDAGWAEFWHRTRC